MMNTKKLMPMFFISVTIIMMFVSQTPMMFGTIIEGGGGGSSYCWDYATFGANNMDVTADKYGYIYAKYSDTTYPIAGGAASATMKRYWTAPTNGIIKVPLSVSYSVDADATFVYIRLAVQLLRYWNGDYNYEAGFVEILRITRSSQYSSSGITYIYEDFFRLNNKFTVSTGDQLLIKLSFTCSVINGNLDYYGSSTSPAYFKVVPAVYYSSYS